MNWIAATILPLVFATVGLCQEEDMSKCIGTTYDMSVCLSGIHKQLDAQLNQAYQQSLAEVKAYYTPQDAANLRQAQRAWMSYRDAVCKAEYGLWGGGSGGPNANQICLIRLTQQRTTELRKAYLSRQ